MGGAAGVEIRQFQDDDWEQVVELMVEAFRSRFRSSDAPILQARYRDEMYVLIAGGRIRAGCRVKRVGQWYGGSVVPCGAVCSMFVAPEARGKGYGRLVLAHALAEMRAAGMALSTLTPSSLSFYRRLGYEVAGFISHYRAPARSVPAAERLDIAPWDVANLAGVARCYANVARHANGLIARTDAWWDEYPLRQATTQPYTTSDHQPMYRFATRAANGEVSGYMIYAQRPHPVVRYAYDMVCTDFIWSDAAAARNLLGLVAANRAIGGDLHWVGPVDEPLAAFFPEWEITTDPAWPWASRIVDLPGALTRRGYPAHVNAEVALTVSDPLQATPTAIHIHVADGAANVTTASDARASIDIGALTAIYTGWLAPRDAARTGRLTDASRTDVLALEALFAGPKPWVSDAF